MSQPFTPEYVYNLIAANPQGRAMVENFAKMNELQQAAQQFAPQIQQFAQNPMQAMNSFGNWAQGAQYQMQQPQQQTQVQNQAQAQPVINEQPIAAPESQPQQGGAPMGGGMMDMAMGVISEFKAALKSMDETMDKVLNQNIELLEKINALTETVDVLSKNNKTLTSDVALMKKDIAKLAVG